MKTNFIDTQKGLICSCDLSVLPYKGVTIKRLGHIYYIDEVSLDLNKMEYNIYVFEL